MIYLTSTATNNNRFPHTKPTMETFRMSTMFGDANITVEFNGRSIEDLRYIMNSILNSIQTAPHTTNGAPAPVEESDSVRHLNQDTEFDRRAEEIASSKRARAEDFRTIQRFIKEHYNRETGEISLSDIKDGLQSYIRAAYPGITRRNEDSRFSNLLQDIAHKAEEKGKQPLLESFRGAIGSNPTYYVHSDILNA